MLKLWSIFWRTFAALGVSAVIGAQAWVWNTSNAVGNAKNLGWALAGAAVGGLIAAGWAFVASPATTAIEKAFRAAVQALLGSALAGIVITSQSSVLAAGDLVAPALSAVVLAFAVTYFGAQAPSPAPVPSSPG